MLLRSGGGSGGQPPLNHQERAAQTPTAQILQPASMYTFSYFQRYALLEPAAFAPPSNSQFDYQHDATLLSFPDVPATELAPIQPRRDAAYSNSSLPSLSSLTSSQSALTFSSTQPVGASSYSPTTAPTGVTNWPSMNPLTAYYTPSYMQGADSPQRMDLDVTSNGTVASPDRHHEGRASSVSLDDPDVRMAAEALGDLRAGTPSPRPLRPGAARDC